LVWDTIAFRDWFSESKVSQREWFPKEVQETYGITIQKFKTVARNSFHFIVNLTYQSKPSKRPSPLMADVLKIAHCRFLILCNSKASVTAASSSAPGRSYINQMNDKNKNSGRSKFQSDINI
jgi:hypothetical protein